MPSESVNKLTRMFQDIKTSLDFNKELQAEIKNDLVNVKVSHGLLGVN